MVERDRLRKQPGRDTSRHQQRQEGRESRNNFGRSLSEPHLCGYTGPEFLTPTPSDGCAAPSGSPVLIFFPYGSGGLRKIYGGRARQESTGQAIPFSRNETIRISSRPAQASTPRHLL